MNKWAAIVSLIAMLSIGPCVSQATQPMADAPVLFVCEHGNVKSLMAMSYFNRIARERKLPFVGISRGTAPDSTTVPKAILDGLRVDGLDASDFRPTAVTAFDVSSAYRVIVFGVSIPPNVGGMSVVLERWDDVPPASVNFEASSKSIKTHVDLLINELENSGSDLEERPN